MEQTSRTAVSASSPRHFLDWSRCFLFLLIRLFPLYSDPGVKLRDRQHISPTTSPSGVPDGKWKRKIQENLHGWLQFHLSTLSSGRHTQEPGHNSLFYTELRVGVPWFLTKFIILKSIIKHLCLKTFTGLLPEWNFTGMEMAVIATYN